MTELRHVPIGVICKINQREGKWRVTAIDCSKNLVSVQNTKTYELLALDNKTPLKR